MKGNNTMKTIREYIVEAAQSNVLNGAMEWDDKHGPTEEEIKAFELLFGPIELLFDTDIKNAHDDSSYTPEELEAAYEKMRTGNEDKPHGLLYGTDTIVTGWESIES
jgi:hypothetical protein